MTRPFNWKRQQFVYTVTDPTDIDKNTGTPRVLFIVDAQTEIGPPPKAMKHQTVLAEIEVKLNSDFGERIEPTPDESGTIDV